MHGPTRQSTVNRAGHRGSRPMKVKKMLKDFLELPTSFGIQSSIYVYVEFVLHKNI